MNWVRANWKQIGVALASGAWLYAYNRYPQYSMALNAMAVVLGGLGLHLGAVQYKGSDNASGK